ncbi:(2Fe-2S) ferredoxin domain-containing protein [Sphingomonas baiyangensis]|uniref:(2Fe-2S) ferredoxin domain-containing protein n=1 Tax=Sphingomonas baiyangensis TaxID=2572576 RepID=A0A4U1L343_9SPHN|nr:(2Fe-2S) ferredoxin domain-containing protein [Sphingomonas baiyangensis]TKD50894.1 (2Fe-2S) ferredoxin domain-containing protein [Sphingomonas baiyangensis]
MKREVRSNWQAMVLVCGKCSKKLGGGFGDDGRKPLAKALRRYLGLRKGRKGAAGIVETRCMGVCPKGAVVVLNGADARVWHLVPPATDLGTVARTLGLEADQPA